MPIYRQNNWNSLNIISPSPSGFMVNIKYEKLQIFDSKYWVDLTDLDSTINSKWQRLTKRYILANARFNNKLTEYLASIKCTL